MALGCGESSKTGHNESHEGPPSARIASSRGLGELSADRASRQGLGPATTSRSGPAICTLTDSVDVPIVETVPLSFEALAQ